MWVECERDLLLGKPKDTSSIWIDIMVKKKTIRKM